MHCNKIAAITVIAFFVLSLGGFVQAAEELEITTYYPAPYGVYKQLRLFPRTDIIPGVDLCTNQGNMFYDATTSMSYICDGTNWQTLESPWTVDTSGGFPAVSIADPTVRVGIGIANPTERLDVAGNITVMGDITTGNQFCLPGNDCISAWPADTSLLMPPGQTADGDLLGYGFDPGSGQTGWIYEDAGGTITVVPSSYQ